MAARWSSESVVAEHRELQANAMALDRRGEFTLLAGRRALALIRLDSPSEVVKRVSRTQQKYDVTAAEWNPTQSQGHTFVLAFGERAEICQWNEGSLNGISSLRAHTRTITDLNWHRLDPNLLATCSIDTFVHIWDTREPRKPVASLSSIAGASQVKWNKLNHNLLASGHDCDVRVWDNRKPTQPTQFISAHLSKIQGLDWSPNHESHLVTSSNDCTVKFFDILNPRKAENFINTLSPVWRARYTPFGEGVVTVVAPQLRRGENPLLLWAVRDVTAPVHTFVGHSDMVLEFEWRLSGGAGAVASGPGEHQLVTWARDHSLRIWRVDQHLQRLCGEEAGLGESTDSEFNSESATLVEGEAGRESGLMREEQDTHSLSGGNEDDAESNSPRYEGGAQPPEASENAVHRASLESSSTTEASEVTVAPASVEKTAGENVSSVSSVAGTPSLPGLAIAKPLPSQASTLPSGQPMSLQQEFSLLNTSLDSSQVNSVEVVTEIEKRLCQVTAKHRNHTVSLTISFPVTYPRQHTPAFKFSYGTTIDYACKADLLKVLKNTASQYQRKRKPCLEPCIRVFVMQLKALLDDERMNSVEVQLGTGYGKVYGSYQDHSVPFPRTSGARFSSADTLVCFARPTFLKKGSLRTESSTPRSLSALAAYITNVLPQMSSTVPTSPKYNYSYPPISPSPSAEHSISISNYYYQDKKVQSKQGKSEDESGRSFRAGNVLIYDVNSLMPFSKDLGATYVLDEGNVVSTCTHNRDAAAAVGRKDLVQVWSLAAHTASLGPGPAHNMDFPWAQHPFGQKLINSLLNHYLALSDVQTATMLACVFGSKTEPQNTAYPHKSRPETNSMGGSPYNTIHGLSIEGWDTCMVRHNRSNSEGSLSEAARPSQEVEHSTWEAVDPLSKNSMKFLDCDHSQQFDEMKRAYANLLYRWGLLEQHAMVLKYIQMQPSVHKGVDFQIECVHCGQATKGPQCLYCRRFSFNCSICHVAVKGASNFCVVCGHGGHAYHILDWFRVHPKCPTGCGCDCLQEMEHLFR
ncbi:GATOR complex protein WDR59-like isoform X5 [Eriocheir sinensis]|uniref:GATOR complex protein WDR59-like isoform X5 n=1 Tax=Eriocheir sinensis TaxID=95602 RepID=UPI0021C945C6|nr:GATOR complex protein WDR59-like isoform X5 [Eriocheir sinensis]